MLLHSFSACLQDDREIAIHFRWTTHGKTDMLNCHPYDVIPGFIAMMHNGVLHTGNAADKNKSDTWHFIQGLLAQRCVCVT
jgi:predicted glutamine amidotransferase